MGWWTGQSVIWVECSQDLGSRESNWKEGESYEELLFLTLSHSAWVGFEIKASIFKSVDWAQCNHFPMINYIKLQDPPCQCFALSLWRSISSPTQWGSSLSNGSPVSALSAAANDSPQLTQGRMEMKFGKYPWTPLAGDDGGWNISKSRPSGKVPAEWSWITGWRASEEFSSSLDKCSWKCLPQSRHNLSNLQ